MYKDVQVVGVEEHLKVPPAEVIQRSYHHDH